jgi:hypothetical protein
VAIAVEGEQLVARDQIRPSHAVAALGALGWLAIAGAGSLGAGAIHAAAIGVHSEHRQAVITFTFVAAIQLGWGALALARPGRVVVAVGALANAVFLGGWVLAKTNGISFIDGLEESEPVQFADAMAAGLAVVAVLAAVSYLLARGDRALKSSPLLTGVSAIVIAALAVPAMVSAGSHSHAGGHDEGAAGGHAHASEEAAPHAEASAVPPKVYDPTLPLDLGGVEGVTLQQQAAAENLLAITIMELPQFADPAVAERMGFVSIGDGFLGHEHYLNQANMNDDKLLDPDYPESLVYDTSVTPKKLVAAMYMMNPGDTLADVPELGGKLTQWHVHDNLCFAGPKVAGLTDAEGQCAAGLTKGAETPMIHVWTEPHPCGPFAALEGVAGGTIKEGEERLCDHAHGGGV